MHRDSTSPPAHVIPRSALARRSVLLAVLCLAACDDPDAPADAPIEALDELPELPLPPAPSADEIAALQAERRAASLPIGQAGRVDIVDIGGPGAPPHYTYFTVGGGLPADVLKQLVHEQGATPAEVFVALAEDGAAVPGALLADHRTRAEADPELDPTPRRLAYTTLRTYGLDIDNHECLGANGNPKSFVNWRTDWVNRFQSTFFKPPYQYDQNQDDGQTGYSVPGDATGRVLSACNAAQNDIGVVYWMYTGAPGAPYTMLWALPIDSFDAVHFFSDLSGPPYLMTVHHTHPDPNTYVAYGKCGNIGC